MVDGSNTSRFLVCGALLLAACGPPQDSTPALMQAFVGPASLNLRQELSTKAAVSATVHHGEPLDILEFKRRFLKVRTAGGIVGWTEVNQLLATEQMADLRRLAEGSARFPGQGIATTYEALNVHTEPNRASASFTQIPEGGKVEVIGHRITPRIQPSAELLKPPPQKPKAKKKQKEKGAVKVPPPPMPSAPPVPSNWLELSGLAVRAAEADHQAEPPKPVPPTPVAPPQKDDWSLIRTRETAGQESKVGWVLSSKLTMAIPDEVAQYAEGHRITSYFPIGDVKDEDGVKHNWLWTTIGKGPHEYEFDKVRFFVWSRRHHRYETAFKLGDLVGHYPVEVTNTASSAGFSLIVEDDDGKLVKKNYTFNGYRVHLEDVTPYVAPKVPEQSARPVSPPAQPGVPLNPNTGFFGGLKQRFARLFKR